jgi:hypothetical protein
MGDDVDEKEKELEAQLAAIQAKRAAFAAAREKAKRPDVLKSQLEAEVRDLEDDQAIVALEDEHGADGRFIKVIRTDLGAVILRRAHAPAFKRFQDLRSRENSKVHELSEQLVRPCLLHPSKERFDEMLREQPHILIRCANGLAELAGVRAEEVSGK